MPTDPQLTAGEAKKIAIRMKNILDGPHSKTLVGDLVVVEPLQFVSKPPALEKCVCCRRWPDMVDNCCFRGCPHK